MADYTLTASPAIGTAGYCIGGTSIDELAGARILTLSLAAAEEAALDQDDVRLEQPRIINLIDSNKLVRDAGGKPVPTFPHPALAAAVRHSFGCALPPVGQSAPAAAGAVLLRPGRERAHLVAAEGELAAPTAAATGLYWLDQSDYWVVLRLEGPLSVAALQRGWPIDLHPRACPVSAVRRGSLGGIACILHRVSADAFRLMVPRSYARAAFHHLTVSLRYVCDSADGTLGPFSRQVEPPAWKTVYAV